jgi:hypothetical protein
LDAGCTYPEAKFARPLNSDVAVNKPTGDNARKGAVKKRTQLRNKMMGKSAFTKRNKVDGEFMAVKKRKKFKGVKKEKAA